MTVADALAAARAAHARFQAASGHNDGRGNVQMPDDTAAAVAVREAAEARQAAVALDPQRRDPAWADDEAVMRVASKVLEDFYADYFTADVPL